MNQIENKDQALAPSAALLQMMSGFWVSAAIYAAAKLGLADLLAAGPGDVDDRAKKADAHPASLYRLLRTLAGAGLFAEVEPHRFALTPVGECLASRASGSLRSYVITAKEMGWEPWGHILHSIRTGETAFEHVHGKGYFDYLRDNPELGELFNEAMTGFVASNGMAVAATYDFPPYGKIVDVGGGHGALASAILNRYPGTRAIIADLPDVLEGTRRRLETAGLSERCECIAGDFFDSVPAGGDACLLASVMHDWDDAHALRILGNCRRAMPEGARLLVIEMVIPAGDGPFPGKLFDLMMLVNLGGRERTEEEYRRLLSASGFRCARIIPAGTPASIIEAFRT